MRPLPYLTSDRARSLMKRVFNACRYAERKKKVDWKKREEEFAKICDKHRSKDGNFDVIVPSSGGKDSGFTAHTLKPNMACTALYHLRHLFIPILVGKISRILLVRG